MRGIKKEGEIKRVVKLFQVGLHLQSNADKHEDIYISISKIETYMVIEDNLTLGSGHIMQYTDHVL